MGSFFWKSLCGVDAIEFLENLSQVVFFCRKHTRVAFCKTKPFVFLVGDLNPYPFLGTNISLQKGMFDDDVPFPKVGFPWRVFLFHSN